MEYREAGTMLHTDAQDPPSKRDLFMEQTRTEPMFLVVMVLNAILLISVLSAYSVLGHSNAGILKAFVLPSFSYYGCYIISRNLARYRLRCGEGAATYIPLPSMSRIALLRHITASADLMQRVPLKTTVKYAPTGYSTFHFVGYIFGFSTVALTLSGGVVLFADSVSLLKVVQLILTLPVLALSVYAVSTLQRGFLWFALGSEHIPEAEHWKTFESITYSSLQWDPILGREYLRLNADGVRIKLYNHTDDPLYLIRLVKYRITDNSRVVERDA